MEKREGIKDKQLNKAAKLKSKGTFVIVKSKYQSKLKFRRRETLKSSFSPSHPIRRRFLLPVTFLSVVYALKINTIVTFKSINLEDPILVIFFFPGDYNFLYP